MIKNEEYIDYLKKIIACVSHGDYYSIKELSTIKLDTLKKNTINMEKELQKYLKTNKCQINQKDIKNKENRCFENLYMEYLLSRIKEHKALKEIASIEEFMKKIQDLTTY